MTDLISKVVGLCLLFSTMHRQDTKEERGDMSGGFWLGGSLQGLEYMFENIHHEYFGNEVEYDMKHRT
jgi:hypothetical protein